MISRSYVNLLDLAEGNFETMNKDTKSLHRVSSISACSERIIIVSNQLPLKARRSPDNKGWIFEWNEDALVLQLKNGLPEDMEVFYIGSLKFEVDPKEQDDVAQVLLDKFKCVPTFLPPDLHARFYDGFCKKHLWPLFHYMLPFTGDQGTRFNQSLWEAYMLANKLFFQRVIEVINPDDDYIWIHDYHLMVLPNFLRRRFNRVKIGFFLHSPFPSSEIYRTLPVRDEILKALLNSDIIGFHTFDYARHFLSCCSRMLGVEYQSKRGYIGVEYYGRTIGIKIMPVGVDMNQIQSTMKQAEESQVMELKHKFEGKTVFLGVDDMDIFKGIDLKIMAMEHLLKQHPKWQGKIVLVQIVNPPRGKGIDIEETRRQIHENCQRINKEFQQPGYEPIVFLDRSVSATEKVAYYSIAECVVVTAVRDGMNLTPYEYIVCRQGLASGDDVKKSMLVISEFIGCSPSLSGAIRVNPWNVEATAEAMNEAISMSDSEKQLRHEKHYRYISTHDVAYWSHSFLQDFSRVCSEHFRKICWGMGFGFGFRVMALDPNFKKLSLAALISDYKKAKSRAILLDYDGTVMPQNSINKSPSDTVLSILNLLTCDLRNTVFIVSGRGRNSLSKWFSSCPKLGIAAEHGYFLRWSQNDEWGICGQSTDFGWMQIAEPVMKLYTEATDGSSIETKESGLVWQYRDADSAFGSSQAKEMLDHLESVLANEPAAVKSGQYIVEVKPQGVSKGRVVEKVFTSMGEKGKEADFVLCIGDDRSDEDMFEMIINTNSSHLNGSIFACTVGQKPSKAKFYLDDTSEVISLLESLAEVSAGSSS